MLKTHIIGPNSKRCIYIEELCYVKYVLKESKNSSEKYVFAKLNTDDIIFILDEKEIADTVRIPSVEKGLPAKHTPIHLVKMKQILIYNIIKKQEVIECKYCYINGKQKFIYKNNNIINVKTSQ